MLRRVARNLGLPIILLFIGMLVPRWAHADAPPADSWAGQLHQLGEYVAKRNAAKCEHHCFTISKLILSGSLDAPTLDFEIEGGVLASHPVPIPLFGPPGETRIEGAKLNGAAASIGFEDGHYYLYSDLKHFTLKGKVALPHDMALAIPGPVNAFEAKLDGGRVVEGMRLSGLADQSVHFDRSQKSETVEPTVFQIARAIRVSREIEFETRLTLRSGRDLGVVKFPLAMGERVLDVDGAPGWKVNENTLSLPTSGRTGTFVIRGTLPTLTSIKTDGRAATEWWLLESDAEHRIHVDSKLRQMDVTESPIGASLPSARLFLLKKGQTMTTKVEALTGVDVLAAVVSSHSRQLVLTESGDLVADDTLTYDNNGVDYLDLNASGRPIFLASDGASERVMLAKPGADQILVPLRRGMHNVRVQSLTEGIGTKAFGVISFPTAKMPLTTSRASVTVGLPRTVHPIALLGGDEPNVFFDPADGIALVMGVVLAWLLTDNRRTRILGAVTLAGLWFVEPRAYIVAWIAGAMALTILWIVKRFSGGARVAIAGTVAAACAFFAIVSVVGGGMFMTARREAAAPASPPASVPMSESAGERFEDQTATIADDRIATKGEEDVPAEAAENRRYREATKQPAGKATGGMSNRWGSSGTVGGSQLARGAGGGVLTGVTPVALPMPSAERYVSTSRELITAERPFEPKLIYVSDAVIWALFGVWLITAGAWIWSTREQWLTHVRDLKVWVERVAKDVSSPRVPMTAMAAMAGAGAVTTSVQATATAQSEARADAAGAESERPASPNDAGETYESDIGDDSSD